jgi:hypothetical protein
MNTAVEKVSLMFCQGYTCHSKLTSDGEQEHPDNADDPVDLAITRPGENEQPNRQQERSVQSGYQSPLKFP